jgi:hypothetical protein
MTGGNMFDEKIGKNSSCDCEFTHEQIYDAVRELKEAIEKIKSNEPDTALMSFDTFAELMAKGRAKIGDDKQMVFFGLTVKICNRLGLGEVIFARSDNLPWWAEEDEKAEPERGKREVKRFKCRVCGTGYLSKQEAKECLRSHEWQNKRGRR